MGKGASRGDLVGRNARELPGPGNYDQGSKLGEGTKYTFGERREPNK